MQAVKNNPKLWAKVVAEVKAGDKAGPAGTWNARKAQLAVAIYKKRGGTYSGRKSRDNSLAIWTDEDWGYIDGKPGNRYLPAAVRKELTPAEKAAENRRKKVATKRGRSRASYSDSVVGKFRKTHTSFAARTSRRSRVSRTTRKSRGSMRSRSASRRSRTRRSRKSRK
jgi:hypothetical protein